MPKILIVDDNENNLVLLRKILASAGHKVITAPDGLRGINRFREELPDLVIIDLKVRVIDGIELIRKIRTHKVNSHAPIILSSATYGDVAGRSGSFERDGIDYLQLPFDTDKLLLKVNLLLANKKTLDNLIAVKESLNKKKDFLKSVLDGMCDAVVIIDAKKSTVIGANRAFLDLVGCKEETIKGQKRHHLAKQYDIACCISAGESPLAVTIKTGKYASIEHLHCPGNRGRRYYEISTSPVKNENGELIQVVHVTKDITERKMMEEELQRAAITDDLPGLLN